VATGARVITVDQHPPTVHSEGRTRIKANVTDEADVRRLVKEVIRTVDHIDALINLIDGFAIGRVVETDTSLWHRMLSMNLTAAFLLSRAVLPQMLERRKGCIVHVAARAALEPFPGAAAYIVSKSGLVASTRTLSTELAGSGVTVNGVLPTTIDTPANRHSMPDADPSKWVRPESIVQTLIFLASEKASQINGALIPVG
jgi:NAD(P)-dependent dehydrogenase (short-subunit alcohol dehydrogenase family)